MTKFALMLSVFALHAAAQSRVEGIWETKTPEHIILKIDRQDTSFEITLRVAGTDQSFRAVVGRTTENNMRGLPLITEALWKDRTLELPMRATIQGKEMHLIVKFTASPDGNSMQFGQTRKLEGTPDISQSVETTRLPAASWTKDPPQEPAETAYQNIQILRGITAAKLQETMGNISRSLGVNCDHCHVQGKFASDEKPAKQRARTMLTMVRALNKESFPETNAVTCWTCHRGAVKPQSVPQSPPQK